MQIQKYSPHPHPPIPASGLMRFANSLASRGGRATRLTRRGAEPRFSSEAPAGGFCRPARSAVDCISHLLFFLGGIPPHFGREAKKKIPAPIKKNVAGTLLIAILWRVGVAKPPVLAEPEKSRSPIMEAIPSPGFDAPLEAGTKADGYQSNNTGNVNAIIPFWVL